ncbi:MAG: deoxyribonuclease IV [Candidatus Nanopelagicaceae bacterium]
MPNPRIGAHVPTTGGMAKRSIAYAETVEAEVIQVFASNPRGWAMPEPNRTADEEFRKVANDRDIATYVHAPYLINLGSPTYETYQNSLNSTRYSLSRGADIGALGVVIHTGSAVEVNHIPQAWKQIHDGVMPILEALADDAPPLLLEPTAGQGQSLVKRLEDLVHYFDALENHPKIGVCLDTCHVFAAGHDISIKGGMTATIDLLISVVGTGRLQLIHANDSMDICGALKDRHQNLGEGYIGLEPFKELINHPAVANVPLVLETPGQEPEHAREIAILKKYRK